MSGDVVWLTRAACRNGDPDALYVTGAAQHEAKRVCAGCPVRFRCLAEALDSGDEYGVWGGMTERERRALRRKHPEVTSWRAQIAKALGQRAADWELVPA
ncbi:WhiB family transcriptional regulator [Longispora albida]|uniref:WhiB family transcriptional regulator n=1 Tax=Longispora albida TaxID=203523 RepID=UPI00058B0350|nr:WhiB family transcriptional regulator [Longispora albida]